MTNQQILTKAINQAIDGGWTDYNSLEGLRLVSTTANTVTLEGWIEYVEEGQTDEAKTELTFNYRELIFDPKFAKALWGEELTHVYDDWEAPTFEVRLMNMVIAEDPIKYLGENLD